MPKDTKPPKVTPQSLVDNILGKSVDTSHEVKPGTSEWRAREERASRIGSGLRLVILGQIGSRSGGFDLSL